MGGDGRIYVIATDGGPVKVGVSGRHGKARLEDIRRMSPVPLHVAYESGRLRNIHKIEKAAHRILAAHWSHGEWFNVSATTAAEAVERAIEEINSSRRDDKYHPLTLMERVDRYDQMVAMLLQGRTLHEVAMHFGKDINEVRQILSRMPRPPARMGK